MNFDETIFEQLEHVFTLEKVSADLYAYHELNDGGEVEICSASFDGSIEKTHLFSKTDSLFIASIRTTKRYDGIVTFPFSVEVIVGNYRLESNINMCHYDKFIAELLYSHELKILTIDYRH